MANTLNALNKIKLKVFRIYVEEYIEAYNLDEAIEIFRKDVLIQGSKFPRMIISNAREDYYPNPNVKPVIKYKCPSIQGQEPEVTSFTQL